MEMIPFQQQPDEIESTSSINDSESSNTELIENDSAVKEKENVLPPGSLLTLLDDKNRSICLLKKQIHNQKIQLDFYLRRVLNSPRLMELAGSCVPHEAEENIQINLAMNKFCKQAGLKSKIMSLHVRMVDMEKRVLRLIDRHEDMVRAIVDKLLGFTQNSDNDATTIQLCLNQLQGDSGQVNTLSRVLGATSKLRKKLDAFRTCCNRLIVIEDERNSLVEQVYAIPVTQRMSYDVLLAVQYEKMRLEKEVHEIKEEQKILQKRLGQLTRRNSHLENVPPDSESTASKDKINVHEMLETVNSEAVTLLAVAQEQRDKYAQQISKLRETNTELAKQVVALQQVAREKEELEAEMELALEEFQKLRERDREQLNEFNIRLETAIEEKDILSNKLQHYNNIEEQVKYLRAEAQEIDAIRKQRDYYKLQVDDLQAIRAAYAQLVEHCPARGDEGNDQKKKAEELEKRNTEMASEIESLGDVIIDQEEQIKHLLIIIEKLGNYETAEILHSKINRVIYSEESKNTANMKPKDSGYTSESKTDLKMTMKELQKPQRPILWNPSEFGSITDRTSTMDKYTVYDRAPDFFESVYTNKNNCVLKTNCSSRSMCDFATISHEEEFDKTNFVRFPEAIREAPQKRHLTQTLKYSQASPHVSTTSVEVQSVNCEGKSESLKTTLESSSPIDGVIEVNNSTALSLRLTCNSNCKQNKATCMSTSTVPITVEPEIVDIQSERSRARKVSSVVDEYELMKDSSNETVVVTLPSIHRRVMAFQCVECKFSREKSTGKAEESLPFGISLNRTDTNVVDLIISTDTVPSKNVFDSAGDSQNGHESDADRKSEDEKENHGEGKMRCRSCNDLTSCLKQITSDLDWTLSQPGGKDSLLNAVKLMYNTLLRDDTKN